MFLALCAQLHHLTAGNLKIGYRAPEDADKDEDLGMGGASTDGTGASESDGEGGGGRDPPPPLSKETWALTVRPRV